MTEPWAPERVVDAALARELIEAQFADLAPARVEPFGRGFDNTAYLVNGEWIFRFPRRQVAVPLIEREVALLPHVAARVPLAVPLPERMGRPEERYPWPFAGYRRIPGRTACGARLAEAERAAAAVPLARFLAALHAVPIGGLDVPDDEIRRMDIPFRQERARAMLRDIGEERLLEVVETVPVGVSRPPPVLAHGDLYGRHILVDDRGAPSGVIDWGDIHRGDPAVDLSIGHGFLPPAARALFRQAYGGVDDATWALARFRAAYHSALVVRYARSVGDEDLLREGRLALSWL